MSKRDKKTLGYQQRGQYLDQFKTKAPARCPYSMSACGSCGKQGQCEAQNIEIMHIRMKQKI